MAIFLFRFISKLKEYIPHKRYLKVLLILCSLILTQLQVHQVGCSSTSLWKGTMLFFCIYSRFFPPKKHHETTTTTMKKTYHHHHQKNPKHFFLLILFLNSNFTHEKLLSCTESEEQPTSETDQCAKMCQLKIKGKQF